jgi:four helix bundle protein
MQDFRRVQAWQKSHDLVLAVYRLTEHFPKEEAYGLTSQLRRAACSIPMNVAEGCGRTSQTEFARFLDIAAGSASELAYQLLLVRDLGLVDQKKYQELSERADHVRKMLINLGKTVRATAKTRRQMSNAQQ